MKRVEVEMEIEIDKRERNEEIRGDVFASIAFLSPTWILICLLSREGSK